MTTNPGSANRRKRNNHEKRYQPYPQKSRPLSYIARAYFPRPGHDEVQAMFLAQPSDQPMFDIEFEVLSFNQPCNCIMVRVLEITEYDSLGNRIYSRWNHQTGTIVQLIDYPPRKRERVPMQRVKIGRISSKGERAFLDRYSWFVDVPYTSLRTAAFAKTRHNQPWRPDVAPRTVSSLKDLAHAALPPDEKVHVARHMPENYFNRLTELERIHEDGVRELQRREGERRA